MAWLGLSSFRDDLLITHLFPLFMWTGKLGPAACAVLIWLVHCPPDAFSETRDFPSCEATGSPLLLSLAIAPDVHAARAY
jgi:hypothetical protein